MPWLAYAVLAAGVSCLVASIVAALALHPTMDNGLMSAADEPAQAQREAIARRIDAGTACEYALRPFAFGDRGACCKTVSFDRPFPSLWLMAMRSILAVLSIALGAACAAPTPAPVPAGPDPAAQASPTADAGPEAAAQVAAEAWLAHVDREDYEASWRSAAEGLRQQVTADQWAETGRQVRQQTGAVRNRTLQEAQHTTDLPQAPPGEYVVLIYRTSFERGDATEQVVMRLEDDGEWRTIGFFVRP